MFCLSRRSKFSEQSSEHSEYKPVQLGLLLYLKTAKLATVPLKTHDRRGIVQLRNKVNNEGLY